LNSVESLSTGNYIGPLIILIITTDEGGVTGTEFWSS